MYTETLLKKNTRKKLGLLLFSCLLILVAIPSLKAQVSGIVFRDFNGNGIRNTGATFNEPTVSGITVKAYDATGTLLATKVTTLTGYSFNATEIPSGTDVRLEFSGWSLNVDFPAPFGTDNGTNVQFAKSPATNFNFAINYPGDYIDNINPRVIIPVYANGNNQVAGTSASADAVYAYNYDATGVQSVLGTMGQIGAVWGTAYSRQADKLFYSAVAKRHVSTGSLGLSGLYVTTNVKAATNTATTGVFADLHAINPAFDAGTVVRNFATGNGDKASANYDENMFDAVGKKGIGGMAISDDGQYLYLVNLNDGKLWRVQIGATGAVPNSAQIISYPAFPTVSATSTFRPYAVKFYRGAIYVGGVTDGVKPDNSSVNRADLSAYVYKVDAAATPGTASFTTVFNAPLTYNRKSNLNTGYGAGKSTNYTDPNGTDITLCHTSWHPWARNFNELLYINSHPLYPQPILSGIEFDPVDGSMILGIMDRIGNQIGNANFGTNTGSGTLYTGNAAGDILRASNTGGLYSSFVLENNASDGVSTTVGAGNQEGPGGGEFYFTDRFRAGDGGALGISNITVGSAYLDHEETSTGSVGLFAGKGEVLSSAFDPITSWYSGGIRYYSNTTGVASKAMKLYEGADASVFGKANGLGDIEIISAPAPIEIGNRVWIDTDGNGAQNAGEPALPGVTVQLISSGIVIATAVTDANGNYIFSSDPNGISTASAIYHIAALTPNTVFTVRVPDVTGGSKQVALGTKALTLAKNLIGPNADNIDSDGLLVGSNADAAVTTGVAGANNHNYDFGFSSAVPGGGGGGLESKSLGDAVGKRIFNKAVNSLQGPVDYSKLQTVQTRGNQNRITGVGTNLSLSDILPKQITGNNFKAYISSPVDIPSITNAKEVLSIDYTLNDNAKAVAFATKTQGEVYDHTKAICDRLKGSELLAIQNITVNNVKLVQYNLKNSSGEVEYALSFVIGAKTGRANYTIQSNWLNKDYTPDEVMYNLQLWAVSPALLANMAADILNALSNSMPLQEVINNPELPKTYVTKGARNADNIVVDIANANSATNGYFEILEKANEQSTIITKKQVPFSIAANGSSTITIPESDNYEATLNLYLNGVLQDQVFIADGNWAVDVNPSTSIVKGFKVSNDPKLLIANKEDFLLFRNVQLEATSSDYISLYKLLRGGGIAQNLTGFKTLQFTAAGTGVNMNITLVKSSISKWSDQYSVRVPLTSAGKDYKINLDDFKSAASSSPINPRDITTVIFALEVAAQNTTTISADISKVLFTKTDYKYLSSLESKDLNIYPNPTTGNFNTSFKSSTETVLTLFITEATSGKLIYTKPVNAQVGVNTVPVTMERKSGLSTYIISLEGAGIKYTPKKFILQ